MKNKVIEEGQDIGKIIDRPTPRLDKIANDIHKLLSATAAKFVPEICDALKDDWIPNMSEKTLGLEVNKALRDEMREKILDRFSHQRGNETPWGDDKIREYFRDYLKNPVAMEGSKRAVEIKKIKAYQQKTLSQNNVFNKLVRELPEPPKEPKEEVEYPTSDWSLGPSKYHKLGEDTKTPLTKLGDIRDGCRELFTALTEKKAMPGLSEDLENDFIKPTREYRKFIHELDEHEQAGLYNWLVITQAAITDMLNILDEAKKE